MSQPLLGQFDAIGFDMDNTLYDETLYFINAFESISSQYLPKLGVSKSEAEEVFFKILNNNGKHYGFLFNDWLAYFDLSIDLHLKPLLELFESTSGQLTLFPYAKELLEKTSRSHRLVLMTGGIKAVQENKIAQLGIAKYFNKIIYSSTLAHNKPHISAFETLLGALRATSEAAVYVGDNPLTDFYGANILGITTFQIHNPEFNDVLYPYPQCGRWKIQTLGDLLV